MHTKLLITGGAGYIGSVMTRMFLEQGFEVTVLDSFMHKQSSLLDMCHFDSLKIVRGDCRDAALMKGLLKNADVIIPLAALVGAPLCDRDRVGAETVNYGAVKLITKLASKQQRILFPVTNSGYGIGEKGKFCTEESPLKPISFYGKTKVDAEKAVLDRGNAITFRLATAFGVSPRMRLDLLVNDFTWRAVNDRAVVIFEGHFKRNYIHVRDISRAFFHGWKRFEKMKDRPYNLGLEDANLSKIELCAVIKKVLPKFVWLEAPVGEDPDKRDYIVSNKRILSTGFKPEWPLERGVRELVKSYEVLRGGSPFANA
ncbi:MAG: NAD-dependent epimerase/dehydratase [Elusimicrobia bacterium]|nr:NAD-dependent epimerase/dehydratase [Elusimicrobiota bacterium]